MLKLRGRFVVFEGVEGAGKSTQLNHLLVWLEQSGWKNWLLQQLPLGVPPIIVTREPGGTVLGQQIRQLLLDSTLSAAENLSDRTELLLYAADRAQHVQVVLKPALEAGTLILCDRYTDSTVSYQGYGRGLDLSLIHQLNAIATGNLVSDLTLWIDLEVQQGLGRARQRQSGLQGTDRMEAADLAFHQRVQQGFTQLSQAQPERIVRIEAAAHASEDQVAAQIQSVMKRHLQLWYPQHLVD